MRLVGFIHDRLRCIGRREGDTITYLASADEFYRDVDSALARQGGETFRAADLVFAPPVPTSARIFCMGINYHDHASEAQGSAGISAPKVPMIFGRWESTLVVDGTPVPVPVNEGLDWEVELAVIIGRTTWAATEANAMDAVFGYTAFNDLTARHKQLETGQFTLGKNVDRSGPIGPVLVTKDEIADENNLHVSTRVNGKVMQDGNTRDFTFKIPTMIRYITDTVTLRPGDVIATGTPGGIGFARKPPMALHPGDVVEVEVEGIGCIRTPIVSHAEMTS